MSAFPVVVFALLSLSACNDGRDRPDGALDAGAGDASGDAAPTDGPADGGSDASTDAGTDSGLDPVPPFRHPVSTPDAELAEDALFILGSPAVGATTPYCNECHTLSRARLRYWRALSDAALAPTGCLNDLDVTSDGSAMDMVECIRASGSFDTATMGVFATAATLDWFRYVFRHGLGTGWETTHDSFVSSAGMPRGGHPPMTQEDFDVVAEWFIRGLPALETTLGIDPRPTECLPGVSADVVSHVADMETMGWAAQNRAAGMLMYDCAGATTPEDCFAGATLASDTTFGADWDSIDDGVPGARIRVLYTTDYASAWWTRASVDGRFVSHGAASAPNLRFIDLLRDVVIGGSASYDPAFFPDGSGFVVQGSGARVCAQRVLTTGSPTMLTFTEPGCSGSSSIGLYEHLGTSLDGSDYWAIDGSATYDNGGQSATLEDPIADWGSGAGSDITMLANTGSGFTAAGTRRLTHPYEGDAVCSHSLRVMLTRAAGPLDRQVGFVLRRIDVTRSGGMITGVSAPEIGRYCVNGGKPEFSFDERFFVYHHYIEDADAVDLGFTGPSDPGFAPFRMMGGANSYLVDTTTGDVRRLTNVAPGQYALFPHFRSDGWIYMTVRVVSTIPEHIVVSDAALLY